VIAPMAMIDGCGYSGNLQRICVLAVAGKEDM
jgi:hypothetical protein